MKPLTINRLAAASLRAKSKSYRSLAIGILLAVYLCTAVTVCAYGVFQAQEEQGVRKVGVTDCVLYDEPEVSDEALRQSGLFSRIGHVYVTALIKNSDICLGYGDETGDDILRRGCVEGRMPQSAGEIAMERSALEKLRIEAEPGDTLTFTLQPIDGVEEERGFTLVGILNEQSGSLKASGFAYSFRGLLEWPSAWVSPEEPAFAAGRSTVHRVMTYAPLVGFSQVKEHHSLAERSVFAVSHMQGRVVLGDPSLEDAVRMLDRTIVVLVIGASLLLSTGIGISSAMESVLTTRTEEIGLLRAVGATKRQIRRVFGRDAWLLSLVTLPAGLLLGCLTAWLFSLIRPEYMVFALSLWLLLPVAVLSALCIFISSALPLRRAAEQTPLGVLRDTAMLRRAGGFKSRTEFQPTALIAGRQLRLHPLRQIGAILMVTLSLFMCSWLGEVFFTVVLADTSSYSSDFYLGIGDNYSSHISESNYSFARNKYLYSLSAQDLEQLRSLPHVEQARVSAGTEVSLLLDGEIPNYFRTFYSVDAQTTGNGEAKYFAVTGSVDRVIGGITSGLDWLLLDEESPRPPEASYGEPGWKEYIDYLQYEQMRAAADAQGIGTKLLPIHFYIADVESYDLDKYIASGQIDLAALDAGEQVLVQAPPFAAYLDSYGYDARPEYILNQDIEIFATVENDYFYAGQTLNLMQLINSAGPAEREDYATLRAGYAAMERHDAAVTVGAVLNCTSMGDLVFISIVTTEKGARALGIEMTSPQYAYIKLDGPVDRETEESLEASLNRIASRADLSVYNYMESVREQRRAELLITLLLGGMTLLFFAVSVAMQVGNAGRRIRSDSRMIGTLRAVGADERALFGCYRLPVLLTTGIGTAIGLLLYLWSCGFFWSGIAYCHPIVMLPALTGTGLLCALCCLWGLKGRLRRELSRSIVENIREL